MKMLLVTLLFISSLCAEQVVLDLEGMASLNLLVPESKSNVSSFMVDQSGKSWFGTTDGLLYVRSGKTTREVSFRSEMPDTARRVIRALTQTSDGAIWVGTDKLYRFKDNIWSEYTPESYY